MNINTYPEEFQQEPGLIYLNHAAVSPWPARAVQAVQAFAGENMRCGALNYQDWMVTEQALRDRFRRLIHAESSSDIALLKNTSEALSFVAAGLHTDPADNIVIGSEEFPSNRLPWENMQRQGRAEVRSVSLLQPDQEGAEERIMAACDEKTRLISISAVQYASGLRLDLARIGEFCRKNKILFCVDGIQQLGALRLDVSAIGADFLMADGHKWLLGPEGLALFYCRPSVREKLELFEFGWHMTDDPGNFEKTDWRPADDARRFECGSPNLIGAYALNAALSLLEEVGMEQVERNVMKNTQYIIDYISNNFKNAHCITPTTPDRHAGIVSFALQNVDTNRLLSALREKGVICTNRSGFLRLSPHFYNSQTQLQSALETIEQVCRTL